MAASSSVDTGIGIPAEHLPRVFDRFYRVDPSRSPETDGTGLGLAICRSIAEAHGGRLEIDSNMGEGTRATLLLPVHREEGLSRSTAWLASKLRNPEGHSCQESMPPHHSSA